MVLAVTTGKIKLDYCSVRSCETELLSGVNADFVRIKILIDGNAMYENEICLQEEIIF